MRNKIITGIKGNDIIIEEYKSTPSYNSTYTIDKKYYKIDKNSLDVKDDYLYVNELKEKIHHLESFDELIYSPKWVDRLFCFIDKYNITQLVIH